MIYVIATPIGNLGDITFRAVETLKTVDYILVEDTRRTGKLLKHLEIEKKMIPYNDLNKEKKTPFVIEDLKAGKEIAIVSDSGTPGISDPGFYLVRECVKNGIGVVPIPGATACVTALVASGLATDKFTFHGFVPKKQGKRASLFNEIKERNETAIVYDSPHRLKKNLIAMQEIMPDNQVVVARELTKKFEEFLRGTPAELIEQIKDRVIKGELVVLISKL